MADSTRIEWADATFNPWIGCTKVGPGCDHCYAEADFDLRKHRAKWGPGNPRSRTSPASWKKPLQWDRQHAEFFAQHGRRRRVFCASLADVFDNEVPDAWRMDLFSLIAQTPNLDWLLLTKRIGNVMKMCSGDGLMFDMIQSRVWLGATLVNQDELNRDVTKLLAIPARVRFLSMEPLLEDVTIFSIDGPVDVPGGEKAPIDWVIVGGESGPHARPMHPEWARSLRDQCAGAGIPFLFKQWGEWLPGHHYTPELQERDSDFEQSRYPSAEFDRGVWDIGYRLACETGDEAMYRVGKKAAGRLLDGVEHNGYPS